MGYRSDVVVAVPKTVRTQCMLNNTWPVFLDDEHIVKEHNDVQIWEITGIKWYEGVFPEVAELIAFFSEHCFTDSDDIPAVAAVRLGEEFGDCDTWGSPYDYDIYVNQEISY